MAQDRDPFEKFPSFKPMFGELGAYGALLHLQDPEAISLAGSCLKRSEFPYEELSEMMKLGWRTQLVAAVSLLDCDVHEQYLDLLWYALDTESWVVPQLTVLVSILDPDAVSKMKKRLLMGCPVLPRADEDLSPMERHVLHGTSVVSKRSDKAWSAYCWRLSLEEECMDWMLQRFTSDEAWQRLLDQYGYEGASICNTWHRKLQTFRPDLKVLQAMESGDLAENKLLAKRWRIPEKRSTYQCPEEVLDILFDKRPHEPDILKALLREGLDKGDRLFEFAPEAVVSENAEVPLSQGLRSVILDYFSFDYGSDVGIVPYQGWEDYWYFRTAKRLWLRRRTARRTLEGRIDLTRDRLESCRTDAICYGAKDTGAMGGGAAMAVYQSCGPEILEAAQEALATTSRQVGDVVYTHAFGHECTVYVGHLISIKTKTSQGDWCPQPERLGEGVYKALVDLPPRANIVAFSCLATGEGRADPEEIARFMVGAARAFFRDHPESETQVLFSLPDYQDYEAFQKAMSNRS